MLPINSILNSVFEDFHGNICRISQIYNCTCLLTNVICEGWVYKYTNETEGKITSDVSLYYADSSSYANLK